MLVPCVSLSLSSLSLSHICSPPPVWTQPTQGRRWAEPPRTCPWGAPGPHSPSQLPGLCPPCTGPCVLTPSQPRRCRGWGLGVAGTPEQGGGGAWGSSEEAGGQAPPR